MSADAKVAGAPVEAPFRLASYQPGDETAILALWQDVFGAARSLERWRWQFAENPYGPPCATLARTSSGRLIGQYAVMPVMLNVMGRPMPAAQSLDTMVHREHRMHGIFEASASACYEDLRRQGCALVYGFPNRNSFPGFVRKLQWQRVGYTVSYTLTLSIAEGLRRRVPVPGLSWLGDLAFRTTRGAQLAVRQAIDGRNGAAWRIRTSPTVPAGYDALWNAVKSFEILSLWKDAAYFGWRYDRHPASRFTYHYVVQDDAIVALCVSVIANGACAVLELIVRDQSVPLARHLMAAVARFGRQQGARVLTFRGLTLDFFDEVFRGFRRQVVFGHVFCLMPLTDFSVDVTDAKNWTVTEGDADTF